MDQTDRMPVLVLYGGRSTEHEISCRSARFILTNLDASTYDVRAIGITREGAWIPQDIRRLLASAAGPLPIEAGPAVEVGTFGLPRKRSVVFPVLHGTHGEDGTMQGLFELSEVAFVGPDTLGSAIGMDKVVSKRLAQAAGVPVVPWVDCRGGEWSERSSQICSEAVGRLGLPLFVKPARLGSSVGVTKVKTAADLKAACEKALAFDDRILIEKGLNVREIELAALGGYLPDISICGEVVPHAEFYDYDAKYTSANGASIQVPAVLTPAQVREAQDLARRVFIALELYGMARIDLFLEKGHNGGGFYFNEVNTIPGFTEISQYPRLWQESGVPPRELLGRLLDSALVRQRQKDRLNRQRA